jgi:hypothetical protein
MNLGTIQQSIRHFEMMLSDNPLAMWGLIIGGILAFLIFGGLLLDIALDKRRERQKIKAVERLHKHLQSLPGSKS